MSNNQKEIRVVTKYNEQGGDFRAILETALKDYKLIEKQTAIKQKEETPYAE